MDPVFDTDVYGPSNKFEGYNVCIPLDSDEEEKEQQKRFQSRRDLVNKMSSYTAPKNLVSELQGKGNEGDVKNYVRKPERIIDRENEYRRRRLNRKLSPPRHDPFAAGDRSPEPSVSSYADVMREQALRRLEHETYRLVSEKRKDRGLDIRAKEREKEGREERSGERRDKERISDSKERMFSLEERRARVSGRGHMEAQSSKRRRS